ncbi:MAG TPA: L,D-transpeptidase [Acidimicrobiia bacterium]|nr:L,D-transpeptidase [Acidimicrobiia bacterium]
MSPARAGRAAALVVVLAALAGSPSPAGAAPPTASAGPAPWVSPQAAAPRVSGPKRTSSWSAKVIYPTVARTAPRRGARRIGRVATVAAWDGGPVALMVLGARRDARGQLWLRVQLPERPNGRSGWIDADFAVLRQTRWRVVIDRGSRRATAYRSGRRVRSWRVVVGAPGTPTPRGLFAVYERVRQPAGSVLGPFALQLTAHSNTLLNYGGGPGRVAMHGRSGPLLADPLGSARSHGCIRMQNRIVRWLASRALPGTPVEVR